MRKYVALDQNIGHKLKSEPIEIELSFCHHSICLNKKQANSNKERQNRMKSYRVMSNLRSRAKVAAGLFKAKYLLFWPQFLGR